MIYKIVLDVGVQVAAGLILTGILFAIKCRFRREAPQAQGGAEVRENKDASCGDSNVVRVNGSITARDIAISQQHSVVNNVRNETTPGSATQNRDDTWLLLFIAFIGSAILAVIFTMIYPILLVISEVYTVLLLVAVLFALSKNWSLGLKGFLCAPSIFSTLVCIVSISSLRYACANFTYHGRGLADLRAHFLSVIEQRQSGGEESYVSILSDLMKEIVGPTAFLEMRWVLALSLAAFVHLFLLALTSGYVAEWFAYLRFKEFGGGRKWVQKLAKRHSERHISGALIGVGIFAALSTGLPIGLPCILDLSSCF